MNRLSKIFHAAAKGKTVNKPHREHKQPSKKLRGKFDTGIAK